MQEKNITQIEDIISENLHGEKQEAILRFVEYLNANQMELKQWWEEGMYRIPFNDSYLCSVGIDKDYWNVRFFTGKYEGNFDNGFINSIQEHVNICKSCHGDNTDICPKGKDIAIFGENFANVCFQFNITYSNPTEKEIDIIKKLIENNKSVASESECWHAQKKYDKSW